MAASSLSPASSVIRPRINGSLARPHVLGPVAVAKMGQVRCSCSCSSSSSMREKGKVQEKEAKLGKMGGASAMPLIGVAAMYSGPAMALVDDRMTTEGTGLPFGLSNNILVWILLGVFALIWALYFAYVAGLEEDEDSGLSL